MNKYTNEKFFYFDKIKWRITWYSEYWPKNVVILSKINWIKINEIWSIAFKEKWLKFINIPNSVSKILEQAFAKNKLTKINIPNSVEKIYWQAFTNNNNTKY